MRPLLLLLLPAAALALVAEVPAPWTLELSPPEPIDPGFPERLEDVFSLNCTFCHEEIADEWARTQHALAWEDPHFVDSLVDRRRPESCHGCHAPEPLFVAAARDEVFGRKPEVRKELDEPLRHGVSCKSCHLGPDGVIHGPTGVETDAHPTQRSEFFGEIGSNALCASCHLTTVGPVVGVSRDFAVARLDEAGMSCVACHMQPVERSMATDDDDVPTPARKGRSHLLQTPRDPRFLAQALDIQVEPGEAGPLVKIGNRAGHRVPALVGRELTLRVELLDASRSTIDSWERTLSSTRSLRTLEVLEIALEGEGRHVRLVGVHRPPHGEELTFLERELALEEVR